MKCPLCRLKSREFYKGNNGAYYLCPGCKGVFLSPQSMMTAEDEKERYLKHTKNEGDAGYRIFIEPLEHSVVSLMPAGSKGLDYGCGRDPVLPGLLENKGLKVALYDPYFKNDTAALVCKYDFIVCCEVIEHFRDPEKEFAILYGLLKPGGTLFCMTDFRTDSTDFAKWYYKNDKTHVFFYHPDTFSYIEKNFGFKRCVLSGRLAVLQTGA